MSQSHLPNCLAAKSKFAVKIRSEIRQMCPQRASSKQAYGTRLGPRLLPQQSPCRQSSTAWRKDVGSSCSIRSKDGTDEMRHVKSLPPVALVLPQCPSSTWQLGPTLDLPSWIQLYRLTVVSLRVLVPALLTELHVYRLVSKSIYSSLSPSVETKWKGRGLGIYGSYET